MVMLPMPSPVSLIAMIALYAWTESEQLRLLSAGLLGHPFDVLAQAFVLDEIEDRPVKSS